MPPVTVPGGPPPAASDDAPRDPWAVQLDDPGAEPGTVLPPAPRRRRGIATLVAAGVAVAVAGGGGFAWAAFNGDTGNQPERHLPASVAAFVKVDLDPSGPQKVEAYRFLSKFPGGSAESDLRKVVYDRLAEGETGLPPWSEVSDWLGDRAGVGVLADAEAPVVVLQVVDEAKARTSLQKAAPAGSFSVADGWATLSDSKAHLDAANGALGKGTLADDATFRADTEALGDPGVLGGWADFSRLSALAQRYAGSIAGGALTGGAALAGGAAGDVSKQRLALVARFTGGDAELVARTFGAAAPAASPGAGAAAAALPGDTVAAVALSGGGATAGTQWKGLQERLGDSAADVTATIRTETGLRLPGDLSALLGRRFAVALGPAGGSGEPVVGLRAASEDPALGDALDRLLRFTDRNGFPLERKDVPGGYVLATTRQQATALAADGDLGKADSFRDALPDAEAAQAVVYVDVERLTRAYADWADESTRKTLSALRSVGLSSRQTSDGATFTLRVTTR
jgi:hypothetical protein